MDVYDSENYYDGGDNIPASGKGPQYNGRGGNISRVHNHTCLDFAVKPPTNLGRRNNNTNQLNRNPRHSESIDFSSDDEDDNKSRRQPTKKFQELVQHNQEQDNNNQIYDEDIYEGN